VGGREEWIRKLSSPISGSGFREPPSLERGRRASRVGWGCGLVRRGRGPPREEGGRVRSLTTEKIYNYPKSDKNKHPLLLAISRGDPYISRMTRPSKRTHTQNNEPINE